MSKTILAIAMTAALTLPLIAIEPATAASAHNLQSGTSTKNAHDTRRSAAMKQRRNRRGY